MSKKDNASDVLGEVDEHPSYGMLGFSRVTSSHPRPLFGTSIKHRDTIRLTLKTANKRRNIHGDWYYGQNKLFEVEMSYSQFAQLVSSMNVGDGIPVTINSTMVDHNIPECPFEDRGEIHLEEFKEHLKCVYAESRGLLEKVAEMFDNKKTFNKKDQKEIIDMLRKVYQNIGSNQDFQVKRFQEQMEKTTTESKGEIEAFFQNKMTQLAQQAFVEDPDKVLEDLHTSFAKGLVPKGKLRKR